MQRLPTLQTKNITAYGSAGSVSRAWYSLKVQVEMKSIGEHASKKTVLMPLLALYQYRAFNFLKESLSKILSMKHLDILLRHSNRFSFSMWRLAWFCLTSAADTSPIPGLESCERLRW